MTRADRLKIKYAILVKKTGNPTLSNKAKHWGSEKILQELNIIIPAKEKKTKIKLPKYTKAYRDRLQKSAENKYKYAIKQGISPENAEVVKYQTYKVIDLQVKYQLFYKPKNKRLSINEKKDRIDEWRSWSSDDLYPPVLVHNARLINLKHNLDINDSYGYGIMYYNFTTNKSPEILQDQFKPDIATGMIIYKTVGGRR